LLALLLLLQLALPSVLQLLVCCLCMQANPCMCEHAHVIMLASAGHHEVHRGNMQAVFWNAVDA
jgi:hypothetical protein